MRTTMFFTSAVLIALSLLEMGSSTEVSATTWYVHPDSVLNSIQAALDSCAPSNTVLVAPGTYYENIVWPNTPGINLMSELGPDVTIIDGSDSTTRVILMSDYLTASTVIDGFTLRYGWTVGGSSGAGIYCRNSSITIRNNWILSNSASDDGGGISCHTSDPLIIGNIIHDNGAIDVGGGVYCYDGSDATIRENKMTENNAGNAGGAICCNRYSDTQIQYNLLVRNTANSGGGVWSGDPIYDSYPIISRNNIHDNFNYNVYNTSSNTVYAEYNWWGNSSGCVGVHNVDCDPWLTEEIVFDIQVASINAPPDVVIPGHSYTPSVVIQNMGDYGVSFFTVKCEIDDYVDYVRVDEVLDPDSTIEVTFRDWTVPPDNNVWYVMIATAYYAVDLNPSNDTLDTLIYAIKPDTISGHVADEVTGNPVPDAVVQAWDYYLSGSIVTVDSTDPDGAYTLSNLLARTYDIRAYASNYYPVVLKDIPAPSSDIDFALAVVDSVVPTPTWCDFWSDSTTFDDFPVQIGDVITAQDPEGIICGVFTVNTVGCYGSMHVYGDDPTTPGIDEGAESGDLITFYMNGHPCRTLALGPDDPVWEDGGVRHVDLAGYSHMTQSIPLYKDWNLLSFYIDCPLCSAACSVATVLQPIEGNYIIVRGFDQHGIEHCQRNNGALTYDPNLPPAFSDLVYLYPGYGYWIKMTVDDTLLVTGCRVPFDTPLALDGAWNLRGYLPGIEDSVAHALSSIDDNYVIVRGFDQHGLEHCQWNNGALTYNPSLPPQFSDLVFMWPGFGYWIKMALDDTLIYPIPLGGCDGGMLVTTSPINSMKDAVIPTPLWVDFWGEAVLNGRPVKVGDVITVRDPDGVKCGEFVVRAEGKAGIIHVYGDDKTTPHIDEGAEPGDELTFYTNGNIAKVLRGKNPIWKEDKDIDHIDREKRSTIKEDENIAKEVKAIWKEDGDIQHIDLVASRRSKGGIQILEVGTPIPKVYSLFQTYPNPFRSETQILYQLPKKSNVSLYIYNSVGQLVKTLVSEEQEPGFYRVTWDGLDAVGQKVSTGIYFSRLTAGGFTNTRKIVRVR